MQPASTSSVPPPSLIAEEYGAGQNVIVLLHGFGAFHDVWRLVAVALAQEERHVIAYDLPGHGRSLDWPDAGPAKTTAKAVLADLDAREIERAHFVGHSMGGAVAALAALAQPERVASLTLLAPGGFGEQISSALLHRYAAATTQAELAECLAAMSAPGATPQTENLSAFAEMRAVPGQKEKLAEIASIIARDDRQGIIPRERLASLPMSVAVIWGTEDPVLPFAQTADLPPVFQLHPARGAGHMLVEERPELVVDIIGRMSR
ncbi:alpha/beta fold hydrolase [Mesorhizobium sp. KR2-14]|uniref:alpha/beta fold hydrolase n=1 Tax=Mesorhizobium sp. KR2-14 TaxID=3156610 RepID=UPI0032B53496